MTPRRLALLVPLLVLAPLATLPAEAPPTMLLHGSLPRASFASSAVWTGTHAYVLGGANHVCYCELTQIVRYDPATGQAVDTGAALPNPMAWGAAAWDGTLVHWFGYGQISHYNPATGAVNLTTPSTSPTTGADGTRAVWSGQYVYLFNEPGSKVRRYDSATDTVANMSATVPANAQYTAAAWSGTQAYLFGGVDYWTGTYSTAIHRYNPTTDSWTLVSATLPHGRGDSSAVWTGSAFLVYDGHTFGGPTSEILRYVPGASSVQRLEARLPQPIASAPAVWTGSHAFVFGGAASRAWAPGCRPRTPIPRSFRRAGKRAAADGCDRPARRQ